MESCINMVQELERDTDTCVCQTWVVKRGYWPRLLRNMYSTSLPLYISNVTNSLSFITYLHNESSNHFYIVLAFVRFVEVEVMSVTLLFVGFPLPLACCMVLCCCPVGMVLCRCPNGMVLYRCLTSLPHCWTSMVRALFRLLKV